MSAPSSVTENEPQTVAFRLTLHRVAFDRHPWRVGNVDTQCDILSRPIPTETLRLPDALNVRRRSR